MTTIIAFEPPPNASFQFGPTLDNQSYTAVVSWNLFGQRWYLNILAADGSLVVSRALIGSPSGFNVQSIDWSHGRATVTTDVPHSYDYLNTVDLTLSGMSPDGYNGTFSCFIDGPDTFSFNLPAYPGSVITLGKVDYNVNLVAGYLTTSTLVYREANQQFEITP